MSALFNKSIEVNKRMTPVPMPKSPTGAMMSRTTVKKAKKANNFIKDVSSRSPLAQSS